MNRTPAEILSFVADAREWPPLPGDVAGFAELVTWDEGWKLHELSDRVGALGLPGSAKLARLYAEAARNADDGDPDSAAELFRGFVGGTVRDAGKAARTAGDAYVSGLRATPLIAAAGLLVLALVVRK